MGKLIFGGGRIKTWSGRESTWRIFPGGRE